MIRMPTSSALAGRPGEPHAGRTRHRHDLASVMHQVIHPDRPGAGHRYRVQEAIQTAGPGEYRMAAIEHRPGRGVPQDRLTVISKEDFLNLAGLIDWYKVRYATG